MANFLLAEFTARSVKVVLTGEGADELFAGYAYYDDYRDEGALQDELVRSVEGLHSLNLQRCDRVTMAHGLEARVPFLDTHMIELGLALPETAKISGARTSRRSTCSGWPSTAGCPRTSCGAARSSSATARAPARSSSSGRRSRSTDEEFAELADEVEPPLRTKEEAAYYRMFRTVLPTIRPEKTISRFATA